MSSGVEVATGFLFEAEAVKAPERLANRITMQHERARHRLEAPRMPVAAQEVSKDLYSRPWAVSRPRKKLN